MRRRRGKYIVEQMHPPIRGESDPAVEDVDGPTSFDDGWTDSDGGTITSWKPSYVAAVREHSVKERESTLEPPARVWCSVRGGVPCTRRQHVFTSSIFILNGDCCFGARGAALSFSNVCVFVCPTHPHARPAPHHSQSLLYRHESRLNETCVCRFSIISGREVSGTIELGELYARALVGAASISRRPNLWKLKQEPIT